MDWYINSHSSSVHLAVWFRESSSKHYFKTRWRLIWTRNCAQEALSKPKPAPCRKSELRYREFSVAAPLRWMTGKREIRLTYSVHYVLITNTFLWSTKYQEYSQAGRENRRTKKRLWQNIPATSARCYSSSSSFWGSKSQGRPNILADITDGTYRPNGWAKDKEF